MQGQSFQGIANNGLNYVELLRLCIKIPFVNQQLSLKSGGFEQKSCVFHNPMCNKNTK